MMSLPPPGPTALPLVETRVGDRRLRIGIGEPTILTDDWWVALLWVEGDEGLVTFRDLASHAGPPPDPPLFRLGPSLAGGLSGLILESGGRQMLRLRHGIPPADAARPWEAPAVVLAGFRWEPARLATMGPGEIERVVVDAFRRALDALRR
jgi:hypothetical protein